METQEVVGPAVTVTPFICQLVWPFVSCATVLIVLFLRSVGVPQAGVLLLVPELQLLHFGGPRAGCELFVLLTFRLVVTASPTQRVPRAVG